jgi:hypothetical protein
MLKLIKFTDEKLFGGRKTMPIQSIKVIVAIFLMAHGFIHISLSWVPTPQPGAKRTPFFPSWWKAGTDLKWPISKLGLPTRVVQLIGSVIMLLVVAAFLLAALGLFGVPGLNTLWIPMAAGASIDSIVLITLYWHPWLPVGILLDAAILAAIYFHYPASLFSGN